MAKLIGFYPGSFDPFTNGHLYVVKKALMIFDKVIIGIGRNENKNKRRYETYIMKYAIEEVIKEKKLEGTSVIIYSGLTSCVAKEYNVDFLIRGIRNGMDYQNEEITAMINDTISKIDTIYFRAGELGIISSSMVMELFRNSQDVSKYVPEQVLKVMKEL